MASIFGDEGVEDLFNGNCWEFQSEDGENQEDVFDGNKFEMEKDAANEGPEAPVKADPKRRTVRNPRPRLTIETLTGQRGIHTIEEYFKDIKFKGKGHEKQDLDEIMRRLQHWGHRMYPTYKFADVLTNIERIGKKKPLQVHMSRYRLGMLENLKIMNALSEENDENVETNDDAIDEPFDEFDALLGEQIAISTLAPRTPVQGNRYNRSTNAENMSMATNSAFATPSFTRGNDKMSTPYSEKNENDTTHKKAEHNLGDTSALAYPLPSSQPSTSTARHLNPEQLARIAENRRLAQERLRAKLIQQ